jgi:hypothetical protein
MKTKVLYGGYIYILVRWHGRGGQGALTAAKASRSLPIHPTEADMR